MVGFLVGTRVVGFLVGTRVTTFLVGTGVTRRRVALGVGAGDGFAVEQYKDPVPQYPHCEQQ